MSRVPLLDFKKVTVIKGDDKKVLDGINITIRVGEDLAILGPNGSGKSSLIKTITREYYPLDGVAGRVYRILGHEMWDIFDLRFHLGIVSPDLQNTMARHLTAEEVVLSGFFSTVGLYSDAVTPLMRERVRGTLEFLEVGHLARRLMTEMSSGEARRVLIARALVHDPKALVLDEPMTSLDIRARFKFQRLLSKIAQRGTNIILVTHELSDIIPEINRVILIKEGRIIENGPKEQLLTAQNISKLFGVEISVEKRNGYYHAWV